jgi:hypothetical protein
MNDALKQIRLAAAVLGLMAGAAGQAEADLTYSLVNDSTDQSGWRLSGDITTDGKIGNIAQSDILSWQLTMSRGTTSYTVSSADAGSAVDPARSATATATGISFDASNDQFLFSGDNGNTRIDWGFSSYFGAVGRTYLWLASQPTGFPSSGDWTIATASAVPEPSTMLPAAIASLLGLGFAWRHRRGRRRDTITG